MRQEEAEIQAVANLKSVEIGFLIFGLKKVRSGHLTAEMIYM